MVVYIKGNLGLKYVKCSFGVRERVDIMFLAAFENVKYVEHPVRLGWATLLRFACVWSKPHG